MGNWQLLIVQFPIRSSRNKESQGKEAVSRRSVETPATFYLSLNLGRTSKANWER